MSRNLHSNASLHPVGFRAHIWHHLQESLAVVNLAIVRQFSEKYVVTRTTYFDLKLRSTNANVVKFGLYEYLNRARIYAICRLG